MAKVVKTKKGGTGRREDGFPVKAPKPKNSLQAALENDPIYLRVIRKLDGMMSVTDLEQLVEEIETQQATRGIRTLSVKKILSNQKRQMLEAELQNQGYRSRTIEIKMRVVRISFQFSETLGTLKKYISSNYASIIRENATTQQDRNNYVEALFMSYNTFCNELDMVHELCEIIISDYDAAGWSLKRIQDTLQLAAKDRA